MPLGVRGLNGEGGIRGESGRLGLCPVGPVAEWAGQLGRLAPGVLFPLLFVCFLFSFIISFFSV